METEIVMVGSLTRQSISWLVQKLDGINEPRITTSYVENKNGIVTGARSHTVFDATTSDSLRFIVDNKIGVVYSEADNLWRAESPKGTVGYSYSFLLAGLKVFIQDSIGTDVVSVPVQLQATGD